MSLHISPKLSQSIPPIEKAEHDHVIARYQKTVQENVLNVLTRKSDIQIMNDFFELIDHREDEKKFIKEDLIAFIIETPFHLHQELFLSILEEDIPMPKAYMSLFRGLFESDTIWETFHTILEKNKKSIPFIQQAIHTHLIYLSASFHDLSEDEQKYAHSVLRKCQSNTPEVIQEFHNPEKEVLHIHEIEIIRDLKFAFYEILLIASKKINEGEYGIIKTITPDFLFSQIGNYCQKNNIDTQEYSEHIQNLIDAFFGGIDPHEKQAVKLLKVYNEAIGNQEFQAQQKIQSLLESIPNKSEYAQVPTAYMQSLFHNENHILKNQLEDEGLVSGEDVFFFTMDYIDGEDSYTYLLRKLLEAHNVDVYTDGEKDNFEKLKQKSEEIGILEWETPDYTQYSPEEAVMETRKRNFQRLKNICKKHNISIPEHVRQKIENTLHLLHQNNIHHRDLHNRNVMFIFDEDDNIDDVYLIDFGMTKEIESHEDPYKDDFQKYIPDKQILDLLRI